MTGRLSAAGALALALLFGSLVACSSSNSSDDSSGTSGHAGSPGASGAGVGGSSSDTAGVGGGGGGGGATSGAGQSGSGAGGGSSGVAGSAGTSDNGGGSSSAGSSDGGNAGSAGPGGSAGSAGTGGSAGSAGMGGSAGSGAYNPCPTDGNPCKILPFGDSITHGFRSSDDAGYRSQLFKLIVAAKQKVTFTGSLTNGPTQVSGQPFPRMHEGHSGWTIDPGYSTNGYSGISSLVPSPALDGNPHIVLLQIGTNDLYFRDSANMSTRLEALIDKLAQNAPSALIVLAQITPLGTSNSALTTYNGKIPGIVQSHAAKGQHIIGVDMSKMPIPADINSDNVHPNDRGYAYMAGIWYAAIKDLLPK